MYHTLTARFLFVFHRKDETNLQIDSALTNNKQINNLDNEINQKLCL